MMRMYQCLLDCSDIFKVCYFFKSVFLVSLCAMYDTGGVYMYSSVSLVRNISYSIGEVCYRLGIPDSV